MASQEGEISNMKVSNDHGRGKLCKHCKMINFASFSREPRKFEFDTKRELRSSALECPFCWLIWKAGANANYYSWDTKVSVKWEGHGFYAMGSAATRIVFLTEETAETPYGFGRLVRQKTPEELPRNWLRTCEEYHEKCKPLPLRFGTVPMLVVVSTPPQ